MEISLNHWDWVVIVFYFVFIVGIGLLFKKVNKNASDYFRGGGNMLWWMAGVSSIMASLSTWSFTGAAAKVYETGFLLPFSWMIGIPFTTVVAWYLAPRFRQMRVVTSLEAVYKRFGFGTEQFYIYMLLPLGIFWGGIGLNTVGVFMSAALGLNMTICLISLGILVTVMSMAGGQWAVAASDFVQGLLLFLIVSLVIYFSINLPEIGGVSNLVSSLPEEHTDFNMDARMGIVILWIVGRLILNLLDDFNMHTVGAKYLTVKDGRQARGMVVLKFVFGGIIPLAILFQIPAMCAAVVFPNMEAIFPHLKIPEEGAFIAMAFKTLPQGLTGLLICGMFAASMSSMDTGLNRNAGYFVRNVYIKYINKTASESKQLFMGKVFTVIFGALMIMIGLSFDTLREENLFDVFLLLNSMIMQPSVIPVSLGFFIKRTPPWSGWSTVLVGLVAGVIAKAIYSPELFQSIMGYTTELNNREMVDSRYVFISIISLTVTTLWFVGSSFFYKKSSEEHKESVDAFFKDVNTPIDHEKEDISNQDHMQYNLVGIMCLVFGGFCLLGILIPNPLHGRLGFLLVGGLIFLLGLFFYFKAKKMSNQQSLSNE